MDGTFWSTSFAAQTWLDLSFLHTGNYFRRAHFSRSLMWLAHTDQSPAWPCLHYMHGHTFSPKCQLRVSQQCGHHFIFIFLPQNWRIWTQTCPFLLKKKTKKREGSMIQSKPEIRGEMKNSRKLPGSTRRWEHCLCFWRFLPPDMYPGVSC